jgi:hypothetical protein
MMGKGAYELHFCSLPRIHGFLPGFSLTASAALPMPSISVAAPDNFGPNPVPDLNRFSAKFLLELFLAEICFEKYMHEPSSQAAENPKVLYLWLLHTTKKLIEHHLLRPGPNPDPVPGVWIRS